MYRPNLKSVSLPIPEIIANEVLGGVMGLRTPNFGEEEAVGGRGWYRSKERW